MKARDDVPARFLWLPPGLRPPETQTWRQERVFLLVGVAALFAGFDMAVFGLAIPQIQISLAIPEDKAALTVSYFRIAAVAALFLCSLADFVGRRRLLLITVAGQAIGTLLTAFAQDYTQFVWAQIAARVFGYAEEMLCVVVIVEEVSRGARGWANGTLSAMNYFGAGLASLVFAAITILPYGWRSIYVIGALSLMLVAYLRRSLPETARFERSHDAARAYTGRAVEALALIRRMAREYPGRLAAILVAMGAYGFATAPAYVLTSKYLQSVLHYTPGQVTILIVSGGLIGLGITIFAGRLSDRLGRKTMAMVMAAMAGVSFGFFYGGASGWVIPPLWVLGFAGYFSAEALLAGFALEIVPTDYRASVSGLRYLTGILMGALSLALEGVLYNYFGGHGPAIAVMLAALPVMLAAVAFLPEPAGKSLEELSKPL